MVPVFYNSICCLQQDSRRGFMGVAEDDPPPYGKSVSQKEEDNDENLYGTEEELYAGILESLAERYLKDRYALCLEIRHENQVVYTFPKIVCPGLIVEQLKLSTRKL
jgi:tRNA G10  N-methylase Trm11